MTQAQPHRIVWLGEYAPGDAFKEGHKAALALAASPGNRGAFVTAVIAAAEELPEHICREAARYGATRIVHLCLTREAAQNPETMASAFILALEKSDRATDILAPANVGGRDLMARVAAHLGVPLLQDCVAVDFATRTGEKYLLSGRTSGVYELPGPLSCWTLRPGAFPVPQNLTSTDSALTPEVLQPPATKTALRVIPLPPEYDLSAEKDDMARLWAGQPDIMEASVIIAGGRSFESAANFRLLFDVAAPLHAAVGASRSAVDLGYAPPNVQVGQTGVVVSPDLYIACGISGSIFHTVGLKGARKVVAINKDAEAAMFLRSDYGLVGDMFEILPILKRLVEEKN